jgi:hypothetical protein
MHISSRSTETVYAYGGATGTVEANFAPRAASASVAISEVDGDGKIGIVSFEYRDSPSGPNKKKDFRLNIIWPPSVYHRLMTRVTFGIQVGPDGYCIGGWTLDFWS